ncbi:MAG: kynureninase [Flavobacteriales bacterium]|nr:kynureninase [Flavobacteriales bacterium]MCB9167395.1 kynureninase [Flavobacteriales bacterium]
MDGTLEQARLHDAGDPLRGFRDRFHFPQHNGRPVVYFTGNSLGLQPKGVGAALEQELDDWARHGVEGHFQAKNPWYSYHEGFRDGLARIVGAKPEEVVAMNGLTTNLHLLMVSFYRPSGKRVKILCEERPFPSDTYAMASQIAFHGFDPDEHLVEMRPREGEVLLRTEDIVSRIADLGDELALVLFGGVNFYTGQAFDLRAITAAGHAAGAIVGFDLAHAAGNIRLALHEHNADFACWCSYKYLNSGPGGIGGAFVHERHFGEDLPRFAGWWGHDKEERFKMERTFKPIPTAEAWQLSNAPVFAMAPHRAALDIFDEAGMDRLIAKSRELTGYLETTIDRVAEATGSDLEIITPRDPDQRGCQLSVVLHGHGRKLFDALTGHGVIADWREPNVIRMAPVPLYNSFEDVQRFGSVLEQCLSKP